MTEYIVFIEDFDLLFLYDNFFSQHFSLFQGFIQTGWTNQKKIFITDDLNVFVKNKTWSYVVPLADFRLIATKVGWNINFTFNVVPNLWFKRSFFFGNYLPYK